MEDCDILVIGTGIAGASAACELAATARVVLLEREAQPGYHTTGRSAAIYSQNYGNHEIRALTRASKGFFDQPPPGFAEHRLLSPRGALFVARADQRQALAAAHAEAPSLLRLGPAEALQLNPFLRPDYVDGALYEPGACDIDVHALHAGYLRELRRRGGKVVLKAEVTGLSRAGGIWNLTTPQGTFAAPVLVNAAGAWADEVAALAGAVPVGLVPKRRTILGFDAPAGADISKLPLTVDIEEKFYLKPDAGRFLGSPADETPSAPCDAQPEELDLAIAVDRLMTATTLKIGRITHKWAGLRSFVADKTPVVGFDGRVEGFFWLAGQGGYGIQTAPAMARVVAALIGKGRLPEDVVREGLKPADISPERLTGRS